MNPEEEQAYEMGRKAVWKSLLQQAIGELGQAERSLPSLVLERADAVVAIRELCAEFGVDSDWSDDTHLGDLIRMRVGTVLDELREIRELLKVPADRIGVVESVRRAVKANREMKLGLEAMGRVEEHRKAFEDK
jgi:hypothetical protein